MISHSFDSSFSFVDLWIIFLDPVFSPKGLLGLDFWLGLEEFSLFSLFAVFLINLFLDLLVSILLKL